MTQTAIAPPQDTGSSRLLRLTLDSLVPGTWFGLLLISKADTLSRRWHELAAAPNPLALDGPLFGFVEQFLAVAFMALVVGLYIIRKPPIRRFNEGPGAWMRVLVAFGGAYIPTLMLFSPITFEVPWLQAMASGLILVGSLFATWGLWRLRRCFGVLAEVRGLVTEGPYQLVRHPLYVGEWVAAIGVLLPILSPVSLVIFGLYTFFQYRRTIEEEAALSSVFPEYEDYRRKVRRFIPVPQW